MLRKALAAGSVAALALALCLVPPKAEANNRTARPFGFHLSLLGEPFPNLWGVSLNYNVMSLIRVSASYGSFPETSSGLGGTLSANAIGGAARLFIPGANFSPTIGLAYSNVTITSTGNLSGIDAGGLNVSGTVLTVPIGLDWQAASGFNFGLGYQLPISPNGATGLPYINLGWYF